MSLASLTVNLTLGLAKFESDSGKAAQIITRDSERMSRAALTFQRALERQADQATKTASELQTIKAASLGLGDDILAKIPSGGAAFASVGAQGVAAFKAIGSTVTTTSADIDKLLTTAVAKIREVNQQADALKAQAIAQNDSKTLSDDGLKVRLQQINAVREATLKEINTAFTRDKQAAQAAAAEVAAGEARRAAAQKIIDVQNGLTASYRQQLVALRELRDAGALTPAQFKQAGTELVNKQPVRVQATAADQQAAKAAQAAAASALATAQVGNAQATASAQAQVYLGFLVAEAAAAERLAQAQQRQAEVQSAVTAASDRARAAQQAAYTTKVAYIAKIEEEGRALFRTKEAQRQLDAQRAGVSPDQAGKLAKSSVDREFLAGIDAAIAAEEKLGREFGKTTAEILKQQASERGLSNTAASKIGRLESVTKSNQANADAANNAAFIAALERESAAIGKTRSELLAMDAAKRGLTAQAAPYIARMAEMDAKTGQFGKSAFASRNQLLTLQYTISDVVASAGSGISPLTILLQQGGQVFDAFGGANAQAKGGFFKNFFGTLASLVTPARLAIGATAGAVGTLALAFYRGDRESKAFADTIVLTGNYAGLTEGKFNALAKSVAAAGQVTVGASREFGQALASTGQVGPEVFAAATRAAAAYGAATGQNAKDVAQDFASMGQDVAKWATEHNKSLNFITAAQYDQIKALQDQGRAADAQGIVYEALNQRFSKLEGNLGTLDRILKGVKSGWSSFWDAAYDVGRAETIESKLERSEQALANVRERQIKGRSALPAFSSAPALREDQTADAARIKNLAVSREEETVELRRLKNLSQSVALNAADQAAVTKRAIAGKELIASYRESGNSAVAYKKALDELTRSFKDNAAAGTPVSETAKAEALAGLKKKFENKGGSSDAESQRRALLDQDLKFLQDNLAREKDVLRFNQEQLSAIYAQGTTSLERYYDAKQKAIADGVQKELNQLTDEQARLEVELADATFRSPADRTRVQTQLNESIAKSANLVRDADHAAALATYERATALKALGDQVSSFQANLLQLRGDDFGAAQARAAQTIREQRILAARATPLSTPADIEAENARKAAGTSLSQQVDEQERLTDAANRFAEVQRRVGVVTADATRAEEAYLLQAGQGGVTLKEQEEEVFKIRAKAAEQLGELVIKAREFAAATTDPKIKAAAAELGLAYAKSLDAMDPALKRLKDNGNAVGTALAQSLTQSFTDIPDSYEKRRNDAKKDLETDRATLDKKIERLQSHLSRTTDLEDAARLRKQIKDAQAQRDSLKLESSTRTQLKVLERDILGPMAERLRDGLSKTLITEPLEKRFQSMIQSFINGDSEASKAIKEWVGVQGEENPQKAAAVATATALDKLTLSADSAANALARTAPAAQGDVFKYLGTSNDPTAPNYENESDKASTAAEAAAKSLDRLSTKSTASADSLSVALSRIMSSAGGASGALANLPNVLLQAYNTLMSSLRGASSGGGDSSWVTTLLKAFGGGSSGGYSDPDGFVGNAEYQHRGGMAGSRADMRPVASAVFNGAPKFHTGGIVAGKTVEGLAQNEVAAILMGGPRGTREEVLTASDPRHADNISPDVLKMITAIGRSGAIKAAQLEPKGIPRYHTGGIVGAAPNRQSAVAAPAQSAGRSGSSGDVTVNTHNYGAPADTDVKTKKDSSGRLTVDVILRAVANDIRRGGEVSAAGQAVHNWQRRTPRRGA